MVRHLNITIHGDVQGVLFRYSAKEEAKKVNLKGYARNLEDGSVYIEAEGEDEDLNTFVTWCKQGPQLARVKNVEIEVGIMQNFHDFQTF